jgi:hypothetical protein
VRDCQEGKGKKKSTEGCKELRTLEGFQAEQSHRRKSMQNFARSAEGVSRGFVGATTYARKKKDL